MRKLRAHYRWLQIAFAVAWIGVLSLYWIRIKMGAAFQSLLAAGLAQPFPLSVVYVTFIYVVAITAILWTGLCIYLAITGSLNLRRLLRGLCLIAIVVVPSLSSGIFLKGLPLSPLAAYLILWLPLLCCFVAVDTSAAVRAEGIAFYYKQTVSPYMVPRNPQQLTAYCWTKNPRFHSLRVNEC